MQTRGPCKGKPHGNWQYPGRFIIFAGYVMKGSQILILTDRPTDCSYLTRIVEKIGTCVVNAIDGILIEDLRVSALICDIDINDGISIENLTYYIEYYRLSPSLPLIFIARDPSHITYSWARYFGATIVMPYNLALVHLGAAIMGLLTANPTRLDHTTTVAIADSVGQACMLLTNLLEAARREQAISLTALDQVGRVVSTAIKQAGVRPWLEVVWRYDDLTHQHCLLVAGLAAAFALRLGFSSKAQSFTTQAALLHDIGKARIPHAILNKPDRLTPAEESVMRMHPVIGYNMLIKQVNMDHGFLPVVRHHHEYLDGSGYPDGLSGRQIPELVRIVTICDIYAAMIARRPYKEPAAVHVTFARLEQMAPKLDGALVRSFKKVFH